MLICNFFFKKSRRNNGIATTMTMGGSYSNVGGVSLFIYPFIRPFIHYYITIFYYFLV